MISALMRSRKPQPITVINSAPSLTNGSPFSPTTIRYEEPPRRPRRSFTEVSRDASALAGEAVESGSSHDSDEESGEDGNEDEENAPLLPIFSSAYLDALPVYSVTHAIRLLIVPRCETTISWEQLRSPQISQFLVKPILLQIRSTLFSRATLYALIANCYQFLKEGQAQPANVGVCRSRALIAELLAMRLLKEYSLRELIDALSYDFDPLAGMGATPNDEQRSRPFNALAKGKGNPGTAIARISTLEVAIKAQAKRFLAHPVVVQHLEAIWAGTIVFHSAADNLHRYPTRPRTNHSRHYGATHNRENEYEFQTSSGKKVDVKPVTSGDPIRRSASLYDANNASMFKLSRLRVPRYRQAFSTVSYAIMLVLFVALLNERTPGISGLEVVFWFWMGGYMLDEIVGFSEQGFGLYIMSVWNAFDIGILVLFGTYFVLRLYGVATAEVQSAQVADMAYDILGSSAILLFPRLFAFLDHIRYFSQLLIAFRLMVQDLVAILVLIVITCSGFFVAFALYFPKSDGNWSQVVYLLFQILMGFTPAAWDNWNKYNVLGRFVLGLFLVICHFLVVTILVTVLTNSFMTIVKNANEEHQFLFAVNTISSVKSEALFSYIAPSNLFGWTIIPLRHILPFRKYVRLNRTVIKITHFPILLSIFVYERLRLARYAHDPDDLIEKRGRQIRTAPLFSQNEGHEFESRSVRVRQPSVSTNHKDRALEEVFRYPFQGDSTIIKPKATGTRRSHVVSSWMNTVNNEGGASPPEEQPKSVLEQLEGTRPRLRRKSNSYGYDSRRHPRLGSRSIASRSVFSNPDESRPAHVSELKYSETPEDSVLLDLSLEDVAKETGGDGADESLEGESEARVQAKDNIATENMASCDRTEKRAPFLPSPPEPAKEKISEISAQSASLSSPPRGHRRDRTISTDTIIFKPEILPPPAQRRKQSGGPRPSNEANQSSAKQMAKKPPLIRGKSLWYGHNDKSTPNLVPIIRGTLTRPHDPRALDSMSLDLVTDIGLNRRSQIEDDLSEMPNSLIVGSFQTQMQLAAERAAALRKEAAEDDNNARMGRLVLARMNTLEEGFKDILKEVKELRSATATAPSSSKGSIGPEKVLSRSISISKPPRSHRKNGGIVVQSRKRSSTVADVSLLSRSYPSRQQQTHQAKRHEDYEIQETDKTDADSSTPIKNHYPSSN